ncbi:putative ABC transporter permease [Butyricicoccus faecihominis]|uniref:putative ABC transporter permease n=1 Tax=Butyricicoccaceae TaxID=3085642 RepID=UPI00247A8AFB|nr:MULTISPECIES: putative ABC transporter permease [Butyricicoccaceae]MCQ5128853.1 putative ABC transporter permease [Butyricicoccus faecihominis]WNX83140.1 putative ABC transporter permease [Agathobaculum sp. NTUH-O15-33]
MKKQTPGLFALGAAGYAAIEMMWRGYTHWTMALTGGAVLVALTHLREHVREEPPLGRCAAGAALITTAEFIVGLTVNRRYRMQVWDYSEERFNVKGQVCPKYAALWMALAAPIMLPKSSK